MYPQFVGWGYSRWERARWVHESIQKNQGQPVLPGSSSSYFQLFHVLLLGVSQYLLFSVDPSIWYKRGLGYLPLQRILWIVEHSNPQTWYSPELIHLIRASLRNHSSFYLWWSAEDVFCATYCTTVAVYWCKTAFVVALQLDTAGVWALAFLMMIK